MISIGHSCWIRLEELQHRRRLCQIECIKLGDRVWYAMFQSEEIHVPCPVCYGNKAAKSAYNDAQHHEAEAKVCKARSKD